MSTGRPPILSRCCEVLHASFNADLLPALALYALQALPTRSRSPRLAPSRRSCSHRSVPQRAALTLQTATRSPLST